MKVTATAEVTGVDGRQVELAVRAEDEAEEIGSGTHTRVIVNIAKFDARVARKLTPE